MNTTNKHYAWGILIIITLLIVWLTNESIHAGVFNWRLMIQFIAVEVLLLVVVWGDLTGPPKRRI